MINKFLFKDTNGKKSLTATTFIWGSLVVNLKLILSGMTIMGVTLAAFGGGDYAAAMAALGAIYVLRRNTDPNAKTKVREEGE